MKTKKYFTMSGMLLVLFGVLIWLVLHVDVQRIEPEHSEIGLATVNKIVRDGIGVHMIWYYITDWLGLAVFFYCIWICLSWPGTTYQTEKFGESGSEYYSVRFLLYNCNRNLCVL